MPTHTGTAAPEHGAGFPPFRTETFPSQIFWLAITFAFLFLVVWRIAGPRINNAITFRRHTINGDIQEAQRARAEAEAASAQYQAALAEARARAHTLAEETRAGLSGEIADAKAKGETDAAQSMAAADSRIAATRLAAKAHMVKAAEEAAIAIVARLTGETVSQADAAKAVQES